MKLAILVMSLPVVCAAASISTISVCANGAAPAGWDQGSCPPGEFDTHFIVLGPGGTIAKPVSINARPSMGGLGMSSASDEHTSVFAPGLLGGNPSDYLFFVASGIYDTTLKERIDVATMVLSGGNKPSTPRPGTGVWQFNYPSQGYGSYNNGRGAVFRAPMVQRKSVCPFDFFPPLEFGILDNTFDLKYAAPGSVIPDPTVAGDFLMIYEGTNTCLGAARITIGLATSVPSGSNYAGTLKSRDGAGSWTQTTHPPCKCERYGNRSQNSSTVYDVTKTDLGKGVNAGATWTNTGPESPIGSVTIDPDDSSTLYLTRSDANRNALIFKSTDARASWSAVDTGLTTLIVHALASNPRIPTHCTREQQPECSRLHSTTEGNCDTIILV